MAGRERDGERRLARPGDGQAGLGERQRVAGRGDPVDDAGDLVPVAPTEAGARLLEHAGAILLRLDAARADVIRVAAGPRGRLVVGATPLAAPAAAAVVAAARRARPALTATVRVRERDAVATAVATGALDAGVVDGVAAPGDPLPLPETGLPVAGAREAPLAVALAPGHPLAGSRGLRLEDLADARWIDAPAIGASLAAVAVLARADGFRAAARYDGLDVGGLLALVAAGEGLALLPAAVAPDGVPLAAPRARPPHRAADGRSRARARLTPFPGIPPGMADDPLDPGRFGAGDPFSLGVEEELHLVDPVTGALRNSGGAVFERLETPARGEVEREVHACQLELITDVCDTVADAMAVLRALRGAVLATGTGVVGSGTHPTAEEGEAEITDKERYKLVRELLGDAIATPVSALHVHVGMPDAETAIRAFNGMRRHLALLEALSANAPYRHGRDTDLASAREITLRAWPRSGAPRAMTRLRRLRPRSRAASRPSPTSPTTRSTGGSCARTRSSGRSRSARSTSRPRRRTPRRSSPRCTRSRATRRSPTRCPDRRRRSSRRRASAPRATASTRGSRTTRGGCGPYPSCWSRRSSSRGRAPASWAASPSWRDCARWWRPAAARGSSAARRATRPTPRRCSPA